MIKNCKISQLISTTSVNFSLDFSMLCAEFVPTKLLIKRIAYTDVPNNKIFFLCSNLENQNIMDPLFPINCNLFSSLDSLFNIDTMNPNFVISIYNGSAYQQYPANWGQLNSCLYMEIEFREL